jgi:hypothetical protein
VSILSGRRILVIENDPLIALDLHEVIEEHGGMAYLATSPSIACSMVETFAWSLALMNQVLSPDITGALRVALKKRSVPFIIFSAYCALTREIQLIPLSDPPRRSALLGTIGHVLR